MGDMSLPVPDRSGKYGPRQTWDTYVVDGDGGGLVRSLSSTCPPTDGPRSLEDGPTRPCSSVLTERTGVEEMVVAESQTPEEVPPALGPPPTHVCLPHKLVLKRASQETAETDPLWGRKSTPGHLSPHDSGFIPDYTPKTRS